MRHILPSATHERFVIKASFHERQGSAPALLVDGATRVAGRMTDSEGEYFAFDVRGLAPDREYALRIVDAAGKAITSEWPLRTFPDPRSSPQRFRLACITCAGGRDEFITPVTSLNDPGSALNGPVPQFQPLRVKRRLLARALEFAPDALHSNGDHVYWDMRSFPSGLVQGMSPQAALIGPGYFDRRAAVKGTGNERILKNAFGPQIADLYGVQWRSTPVFFVGDDHDYTDNDEATAQQRTFPPDAFMRDIARTTQELYFPELFSGLGMPAAFVGEHGLAADFGVLRYGRLFEGWIYNAKGLMNNTRDPEQPDYNGNPGRKGHPESRLVPKAIEEWLIARTLKTPAAHYAHMPSSPVLWGAGKFAEWYPDVLGDDGRLTTDADKPFWPDGWNDQHDRLVTAASGRSDRVPLWIQGDLHASSLGLMTRTRDHDLSANPIVALCCGTPGTGSPGFPSAFRGVKAEPSRTVEAEEIVPAIEENGFSLVDFTPDEITISMFRWNHRSQPEAAIDDLQPFLVHRIPRRPLSLRVTVPRGQDTSSALERGLSVRVNTPRPATLRARLLLDRADARRFGLPRLFASGRATARRPGTTRLRLRLTDKAKLRSALAKRTPRVRLLRGRIRVTAIERSGRRITGFRRIRLKR